MFSQLDALLVGIVALGIFQMCLSVIYKAQKARPFEKIPLMVDPNDRQGLEHKLSALKKTKEQSERLYLILGIIAPICGGLATITIGFFYIYKVPMIWAWIMTGIGVSGVGVLLSVNTARKVLALTIERIHERLQNMPG
jgi:hypothetical protein